MASRIRRALLGPGCLRKLVDVKCGVDGGVQVAFGV